MARIVADVVARSRVLLQDTREPYRFTDEELVDYVNDSFAQMRSVRPDIFVGKYIEELPIFTTDDLSDTYPIADMYFNRSIEYVVGMSSLRDDQAVTDAKAATFIQLFNTQLRSP